MTLSCSSNLRENKIRMVTNIGFTDKASQTEALLMFTSESQHEAFFFWK